MSVATPVVAASAVGTWARPARARERPYVPAGRSSNRTWHLAPARSRSCCSSAPPRRLPSRAACSLPHMIHVRIQAPCPWPGPGFASGDAPLLSRQKLQHRTIEFGWLLQCKPMTTPWENVQLRVPDQRVCSLGPRGGDVPVFRSMQDQRWHRERMKPVDEVGVEAAPFDLVPLPSPPGSSHSRFLRHLKDFIYQATRYSLGIVKHSLETPPYHPATPAQDRPQQPIEKR